MRFNRSPTIQDWDQVMEKVRRKDPPTICIMIVATISWIREPRDTVFRARALSSQIRQITGVRKAMPEMLETILLSPSSRLLTIQNRVPTADSSHKRACPLDIDSSAPPWYTRTRSNSKPWPISSTSSPWKDMAKPRDQIRPDHQETGVRERRSSHNSFSTSRTYSSTTPQYKWTPSTTSLPQFSTWLLSKKAADIPRTTRDTFTCAQLFI